MHNCESVLSETFITGKKINDEDINCVYGEQNINLEKASILLHLYFI